MCAVMVELIQGRAACAPWRSPWSSPWPPVPGEGLAAAGGRGPDRRRADGSLFAFQQYGILPDVASFAKGIAGGLPMSGILANEKCRDVLGPGTHATTFGAIRCALPPVWWCRRR